MIRFLIVSALRFSGRGAASIRRIAESTLECDAYPRLSATSPAGYPNARLASHEATARPTSSHRHPRLHRDSISILMSWAVNPIERLKPDSFYAPIVALAVSLQGPASAQVLSHRNT